MAEQRDDIDLILQDCLEKIQGGQATLDEVLALYPDLADDLRPPLEAALWFRMRKATLDPRAGFVNASRRRVLEQISREQAAAEVPHQNSIGNLFEQVFAVFSGKHRLAFQAALILLLVFAMIASSTGVARAAQAALPGELLYRVKLSLENAQIALATDEGAQAELHIRFAQRRLTEIQSLIAEDRLQYVPGTVSLYEGQVNQAIRQLMAVQNQDPAKADSLAISLQTSLRDQMGTFNLLMANASPEVASQVDRVILVSEGVISLVGETLGGTDESTVAVATVTAEPTSTPIETEVIVAVSDTALPPTPTMSPTLVPTLSETPILGVAATNDLTITQTPTMTLTIVVENEDDSKKPTKTPKLKNTPRPTNVHRPTQKPKKDK